MNDQEKFYDSLDEEESDTPGCSKLKTKFKKPHRDVSSRRAHVKTPDRGVIGCGDDYEDIRNIIPLYDGDVPKDYILGIINRQKVTRKEKSADFALNVIKRKKSYLSMYYDKLKCGEGKSASSGSDTSRAVCEDILSPRRMLPERDTSHSPINSEYESDSESFYENFMKNAGNKQKSPSCSSEEGSKSPRKISVNPKITKRTKPDMTGNSNVGTLGPGVGGNSDKLELLRRRQSYGQRVSKENKIKMDELAMLKKLQQNSPYERCK